MKSSVKLTLLWGLVLFLSASLAPAEVPQVINYQGRLTASDGTPVDGPNLIKFKIYGSEAGNDSLWWSGFQSVTVDSGFFEYQLGSVTPLPDDLFSADTNRYLGITVGVDPEISPRIKITSVAYAYQALRSDTTGYATAIADNSVTTSKMANLSVTYDKIANGAVGTTKITPDAVTTDHLQDGTIQFDDIASNGAADGQVMKWDGMAMMWIPADDNTGAGGDITAVYASTGLDGGAESGDATLSIADLGVGNLQLANNAVSGSKIQENAVYSDHIMDGQVSTADLETDAVTSDKIATDAVGSSEIVHDAVGSEEIATDAVGSVEIATGAVDNDEIADLAVTLSKIANDAVSSDKILNNTIADADINSAADIAVSKIAGTAVNLSSTQTIAGDKTFNGEVRFGDSTMWINSDGVAIGDDSPPSAYYLLRLARNYNSASSNWGIYASLENKRGTGNTYAMRAYSYDSLGIAYGVRTSAYSDNLRFGVYAAASDEGADTSKSYGVYGSASDGEFAYGIYGYASGATSENWAGYFGGNVRVTGTFDNTKSSIIMDHPLDPENKYLRHSTISSPDMMNVYNGNATLDANGEAMVSLPDYFEAVNENFRYQLTPIGGPAPNLHIAEEISGNRFYIAGGESFMKVSWQVTGVRKDAFAKANPAEVEVEKNQRERGLYLSPEAYGYGPEQHIDYENINIDVLEEEESEAW